MQIDFRSIQSKDISFLQKEDCLYAIDFRATGEELTRNIDAMFKYENSCQWLGGFSSDATKRHIIVNETAKKIDGSLYEAHVAPRVVEESHKSVFSRVAPAPTGVKSLWTAIAHPDADRFAKENNLTVNVTYTSFLKANDKLAQKELLGDFTPDWAQFDTPKELLEAASKAKNSYLKKRIGAGGFNVLKLGSVEAQTIQKILDKADPAEWYIEEEVLGEPQSVQGVIDDNGTITVFGFTRQTIVEDVMYVGAEIFDISSMPTSLRESITSAILSLEPLLKEYVGFFGIDFIASDDNIQVLECNARLTAASIPTLLRNKMGAKTTATFTEDKPNNEIKSDEIILGVDELRNESDTLTFEHLNDAAIGFSSFIQLSEAKALCAHLDVAEINKLRTIVETRVSEVVSIQYHNFWPYGWTATMILAESHCVLSSWHQEKNILVDIFCCGSFDHQGLSTALAKHFRATKSADEIQERHLA